MFLVNNRLLALSLNIRNLQLTARKYILDKIMDNVETDVITLSKRLQIAEENLKLINKEISDIKAKILLIQTHGVTLNQIREFSAVKRECEENDGCDVDIKKPKYDFHVENDYVIVYTDGASENNGKKNAKAGIGVWFGNQHPLNISRPIKGEKATNNVAEIQACVAAIEVALKHDVKNLCIKTDSQFVINSMTGWIHKWKKNDWKLSDGGPVKNKDDFVKLDKLCQQIKIKWEYVPGHSNHLGNEQADALAREGAKSYVSLK